MQSWGTRSRFEVRDCGREPSKSGVIGLLCAALGRPRSQPVDDLAALEMAVRVDRAGTMECDFQTAEEVPRAGNAGGQTVLSYRYYLSDASFLVGLRGDGDLLEQAHAALRSPRWPMFLGRKGYVPGRPPWIAGGLQQDDLAQLLGRFEWPLDAGGHPLERLPAFFEAEDGEARQDVPLSFRLGGRRFGTRRVVRRLLTPMKEVS